MPKYEVKILLEAASFYEQIAWVQAKTPKLFWLVFLETVPYHCQKSLCWRFSPIK
ncbi:MAG: hypothetical protein RR504_04140 [Christensenellaceae bacterium]